MSFEAKDYFKRAGEGQIQNELDCVNALQRTRWKINTSVLEILRICWESGQEWNKLPARDNITVTPYPEHLICKPKSELNPEELEAHKVISRKRAEAHQKNTKSMSERLQVEATLKLAEEYTQYDHFFYQWQLDFRTRKYPRETYLSPQVADYGKSLLTFAVGMEINTPEDATWLAIHGANCYGNDKVSLVDRELWALGNTELALKVAEDPMGFLWWQEADSPWTFLAWCFEWAAYTEAVGRGETFITHLPCQVDGSCNGIQNLSAMLRDEAGGKSVNLYPSDIPKDIYSDVAQEATRTIQLDADNGHELAEQVLEFGICRSIAKKPVMIVPYNGTKSTCRAGVLKAIETKGKGNFPWGKENNFRAAGYVNDHIWDAISEVVTGSRQVMDYIKVIAGLYADNNQLMSWVTPTGFLVEQRYFKKKTRQVVTHLSDKKVKLDYKEDKAVVDPSKYRTSSSPNFVHSMDAAHLTLTVNRCVENGLEEFAMIHDSFGTHSPNLPILNKSIRESFVTLYSENDVLGQLYETARKELPYGTEVPTPPLQGNLDLLKILDSDYFFA